jgi:hypothetical protein
MEWPSRWLAELVSWPHVVGVLAATAATAQTLAE